MFWAPSMTAGPSSGEESPDAEGRPTLSRALAAAVVGRMYTHPVDKSLDAILSLRGHTQKNWRPI